MKGLHRFTVLAGLAGAAVVGVTGCGREPAHRVAEYRAAPAPYRRPDSPPPAAPAPTPAPNRRPGGPQTAISPPARYPAASDTPEGKALADRIMLASDGLVADCRIVGNRDLYFRLGSKADTEIVPNLVRALVTIMHNKFPRTDVAVHLRDQGNKPVVDAVVDVSAGTVTYQVAE